MFIYDDLRAFGAWLGSLPMWVQLPFGAVYTLAVPLLLIWIAIGLSARGRATSPAWSAGILLMLSRPRSYLFIWVGLALACIVEAVLCVATYGQRIAFLELMEAIASHRSRGAAICFLPTGVIAGLWSLCTLPRARRFAMGED